MLKIALFAVSTLAVGVICGSEPAGHGWQPATIGDRRSPCPMLNSLANHGYLPRNGRNISIEEVVNAIDVALNLSPLSSRPVVELAATTSTTGYATTFNLDDVNLHGIIEHDCSLSRKDNSTGDDHTFNLAIYNSYSACFLQQDTLTLQVAAQARKARVNACRAANPNVVFTPREDTFSQFETALFLAVFQNGNGQVQAKTKFVDVMFREERLPYKEGFKRQKDVITNDDILNLGAAIAAAAPVF